MELHRVHILLLLISLALALTVLIDGVTHLSMAKSDFPSTPAGKVAWTNLMMYEIIVPVLSVFGLIMHIIGLHLDFVCYIPETSTEGLFMAVGTAAHAAAWVTIGSVWTACEVGTMKVQKVAGAQRPTIVVNRSGPGFCPQYKFLDGGYSLEGPIPKIKVAFAWLLFVLTLACLGCACKGWLEAKHAQYMNQTARHRRTMRGFEMSEYQNSSVGSNVPGGYETKV